MENINRMYPDMSREEREVMMASQSYKVVIEDYSRTLSDDDLSAEDNNYTRNAIALDNLKGELKEITATFKSRIKALEGIMAEGLKIIGSGKRKVNGKLFLFPDHQANQMRYYDVYGELINRRPLTIDERQTKLFIGDAEPKFKDANDHETEETQYTVVDEDNAASGLKVETKSIESTTDESQAAYGSETGKKKKIKKGADINVKVQEMTEQQKKRKEKISSDKNSEQKPDLPEESNLSGNETPGDDYVEKGKEMEGTAIAEYEQIPESETRIDPSLVPPLESFDEEPGDDNLPD